MVCYMGRAQHHVTRIRLTPGRSSVRGLSWIAKGRLLLAQAGFTFRQSSCVRPNASASRPQCACDPLQRVSASCVRRSSQPSRALPLSSQTSSREAVPDEADRQPARFVHAADGLFPGRYQPEFPLLSRIPPFDNATNMRSSFNYEGNCHGLQKLGPELSRDRNTFCVAGSRLVRDVCLICVRLGRQNVVVICTFASGTRVAEGSCRRHIFRTTL